MKHKLLIVISFIYSLVWVPIGLVTYLNLLSYIPSLAAISGIAGTKYVLYFLWGVPLLATLFVLLFSKKSAVKVSLVSFSIGTIFFTMMITFR